MEDLGPLFDRKLSPIPPGENEGRAEERSRGVLSRKGAEKFGSVEEGWDGRRRRRSLILPSQDQRPDGGGGVKQLENVLVCL